MKNLYAKGKGKIHPSPSSPASSASSLSGDALAVLNLLPAAILALTVVLGFEDKEVLAYQITRSLKGPGPGPPVTSERRCRRSSGGVHKPLFDCGCFDCYTSFWSRWDASPDRDLIHRVIDEFEEHLASDERKGGGATAGGRGRRRDRVEKGKKKKKEKERKEEVVVVEEKVVEVEKVSEGGDFGGEEKKREAEMVVEEEVEVEELVEESGGGMGMVVAMGGERRKGWPDVMGLFNSRLWSLWVPGL